MQYKLDLNSGLNFFHVSSAFQKCVRRGLEHEALWFATELYLSNYEEYIWYRIKVIVSEDIGLANPALPAQIQALYQTYVDFKKKKNDHKPENLPFIHAVLLLVRSKKSRLVDNKLCYYMFLRHKMEQPPLPDFVFDQHTTEGRRMGRGNEFFYEESAKLANAGTDLVPDEYDFRDFMRALYIEEDVAEAQAKVDSKVFKDAVRRGDVPAQSSPGTQQKLPLDGEVKDE